MAMFDYTDFDQVFGSQAFPYDRKSIQEIDTFRKSLDGALFIDRVLKALGLTKGMPERVWSPLRSRLTDFRSQDVSSQDR